MNDSKPKGGEKRRKPRNPRRVCLLRRRPLYVPVTIHLCTDPHPAAPTGRRKTILPTAVLGGNLWRKLRPRAGQAKGLARVCRPPFEPWRSPALMSGRHGRVTASTSRRLGRYRSVYPPRVRLKAPERMLTVVRLHSRSEAPRPHPRNLHAVPALTASPASVA